MTGKRDPAAAGRPVPPPILPPERREQLVREWSARTHTLAERDAYAELAELCRKWRARGGKR